MTRLGAIAEVARRSFWLLPGVGVLAGIALGLGLPALDDHLELKSAVPFFSFDDSGAVRGLLETIATVTVSVAGISFSVTVVALQLASQQLSPRVLRTFQNDRLSQVTLAVFLGTFVYALFVLAAFQVGAQEPPKISAAVAVLAATAAFLLFVAFIHNVVDSLQASTLIRRIAADGHAVVEACYPATIGRDPDDPAAASKAAAARLAGSSYTVRARRAGYLIRVDGATILEAAAGADCVVAQRATVGDFVLSGEALADVAGAGDLEAVAEGLAGAFGQAPQRTVVQDVAFPIRQLADVALRGLSPGINDPTTAENAMDWLTDTLLMFLRQPHPAPVRVDEEGIPRFVARAPDLDDLVRLGFEQVRVKAATYPVVSARLAHLLGVVAAEAAAAGVSATEPERQLRLLTEGAPGDLPTRSDVHTVTEAASQAVRQHGR